MPRRQVPCGGCGKPKLVGRNSLAVPTCRECRRSARERCCLACNAIFVAKSGNPDQRYCTYACYLTTVNLRSTTCEICEASYRPAYTGQRTCGRVCGLRLKREITGSYPAESVVGSRIWIRNCDQCKRLFTARRYNQVTCCRDCGRARQNRLTSETLTKRYHSDPGYRDSVLARSHARHAHALGLDSHLIAEGYGLLTYLIKRDRGRCGICHKPVRAKTGPMRPGIDHIVPLSRGGTHELANVQLCHHWCNLSKNNRGGGEQLLLVG